jgi:hypothetical protein
VTCDDVKRRLPELFVFYFGPFFYFSTSVDLQNATLILDDTKSGMAIFHAK